MPRGALPLTHAIYRSEMAYIGIVELVIDKAGRIVIPKPIRDALRLDAGDVIELERDGETLHLRCAAPEVKYIRSAHSGCIGAIRRTPRGHRCVH